MALCRRLLGRSRRSMHRNEEGSSEFTPERSQKPIQIKSADLDTKEHHAYGIRHVHNLLCADGFRWCTIQGESLGISGIPRIRAWCCHQYT